MVELFEEVALLLSEMLVCLAMSAFMPEQRVIEVVRFDTQAGGDVEPGETVDAEGHAGGGFFSAIP